jgi:hypothetical protein
MPKAMKDLLVKLAERNMRKVTAEAVIAIRKHLESEGLPYVPDNAAEAEPAAPSKKGKKK